MFTGRLEGGCYFMSHHTLIRPFQNVSIPPTMLNTSALGWNMPVKTKRLLVSTWKTKQIPLSVNESQEK